MSNRSLVELNHDYCPNVRDDKACLEFGRKLARYMGSAQKRDLPNGVTLKHYRHHTDPDPMEGKGNGHQR